MSFYPESILVIGASGRSGVHLIHAIDDYNSKPIATSRPQISAFCRDPSKLDEDIKSKCTKIVQGNARNEADLKRALDESKADLVIMCIGNGDSTSKNDIRTASARALSNVLRNENKQEQSSSSYSHVKAVVISSMGAGGSQIKIGFGMGRMIEFILRNALKDHDGQEAVFLSKGMRHRTMIVRPTHLTEGESTGRVIMFGNNEKSPTTRTDRKDLADWTVKQMMDETNVHFGSPPVNITCAH